jgi:hypothetical protein
VIKVSCEGGAFGKRGFNLLDAMIDLLTAGNGLTQRRDDATEIKGTSK